MVANLVNLAENFNICNYVYFEEKLPVPQFGLLHSFRTCGYFHCDYEQEWFSKKLYNICISMTDYYDFTQKQFEDILVHEMIHYYLAYFGEDTNCTHGKKFKKMAEDLNRTDYTLHLIWICRSIKEELEHLHFHIGLFRNSLCRV